MVSTATLAAIVEIYGAVPGSEQDWLMTVILGLHATAHVILHGIFALFGILTDGRFTTSYPSF